MQHQATDYGNVNFRYREGIAPFVETGPREMLGLIPGFFAQAVSQGYQTLEGLAKGMDEAYGYEGSWNVSEVEIAPNGNYIHPGDPVLEPLAQLGCDDNDIELFIYLYGLIALRDKTTGEVRHTRMD